MATLRQKEILKKKLKMAAAGKPVTGLGIHVNFIVSGGVSGEYFFESIDFDSDGNVVYEIEDQIRNLKRKRTSGSVKLNQLKQVFSDVVRSGLIEKRDFIQRIPPDTIVGVITIWSGKMEKTVLLPMDELEPKKPHIAPAKFVLYSGKVLAVPSEFITNKIMQSMGSISSVPNLIKK